MIKQKENKKSFCTVIFIIFLFITNFASMTHAQDTIPANSNSTLSLRKTTDTIPVIISDSTINAVAKNNKDIAIKDATSFKPNPKTAWICAAIFPGFGQIYNRQYWKLPIVYGGFMGFIYAITWNNKNYQDYKQAYFDIMTDVANDPKGENPDSWSQSWQNFIPASADAQTYLLNSSFQNQLKSGKDYYRRYRDLSFILSIAFYALCVADAYVDAQMFDFDISPDLSFNIAPEIRPATICSSRSVGINVCITF